MTRALILLVALLLGCDRADELLIEAIAQAVAEPPKHSEIAADCAKGRPIYIAPGVISAVDCGPADSGTR